MIAFLVIISLMLNILALITIVILYLRQNKLIKMDERQKSIIKEMEELISAYLLEMKEENSLFMDRILKFQAEQNINPPEPEQGILDKLVEEPSVHLEKHKEIEPLDLNKTANIHARKAYQKQKHHEHATAVLNVKNGKAENHDNQKVEETLYEQEESFIQQILNLEKQGNSIEEIAKKLNKGKTEIELLLKFQENIQE
jgi:hypothetical protein